MYSTRAMLLTLLLMGHGSLQSFFCGRSFFNPRPQDFGGGRDMLHALEYYHDACLPSDQDGCRRCGTFSVAGVYEQLFQTDRQANYFFGTDTLTFSGSRVVGRDGANEILADYFGLPTDFRSVVSFDPSVRTAMADIRYTYYTRLWDKRWFMQINAPVVWTEWDLGLSECCCQNACSPGTLAYPAGYMGSDRIVRDQMPCNVSQAWSGCVAPFGDYEPLKYGRIDGEQRKVALADIALYGGVCLVDAVDHFFAAHVRVVAPTGNRSHACYLFEPMVGNGNHWELGGGFSGYARLWKHDEDRHVFHLYGEGTISHLFQSWQKRSYDFKLNGPLSRYVLIEEMGNPIVEGLMINGIDADIQYHGKIMPAINETTLNSLISIGVQANVSLKLVYVHHEQCSLELGYTLWARTQEKLHCRQRFPCGNFAIKGDAQVYGFGAVDELFVGLNATQHGSTITQPQEGGNASQNFTNENADSAALATFRTDVLAQTTLPGAVDTGITVLADVNGSSLPQLICDSHLDTLSALHPLAISNAIFVNAYHRWRPDEHTQPFVGLGGKVEVDGTNEKRNSAQSLWSVWLEGGVSF